MYLYLFTSTTWKFFCTVCSTGLIHAYSILYILLVQSYLMERWEIIRVYLVYIVFSDISKFEISED